MAFTLKFARSRLFIRAVGPMSDERRRRLRAWRREYLRQADEWRDTHGDDIPPPIWPNFPSDVVGALCGARTRAGTGRAVAQEGGSTGLDEVLQKPAALLSAVGDHDQHTLHEPTASSGVGSIAGLPLSDCVAERPLGRAVRRPHAIDCRERIPQNL
jgi:hypothetical protein